MPSLPTAAALLLVGVASAGAQTASRGYVAVKGGVNAERAEDNLRGTSLGGGGVGVNMSKSWAVEAEFWLPGAIDAGPFDRTHRDTLFGVGMRRAFGDRVRPHVLVGAHFGRTQDHFTTCAALRARPPSPQPTAVVVLCDEPDVTERRRERHSSVSWFPFVGGGVQIPLGERIVLIPDVRLELWLTSVIARPALAIGFVF